jgi:enamine deaminase RidA (YjgF/YER057c/UK114 family)
MAKHKFFNPDTIAKPIGYTQVVEPAGPGRIIFISGQLGLDLDNKIVGAPGDFRAQAEQTFVNLGNALAAVGAGFEHVVKLTNYFVDIAHLGPFREVRDRFVDTAAPPASTAVAISALARPGALIEVEAIAVVPAKTTTTAKPAAKATRATGAVARGKPAPAKLRAKATASRKRK